MTITRALWDADRYSRAFRYCGVNPESAGARAARLHLVEGVTKSRAATEIRCSRNRVGTTVATLREADERAAQIKPNPKGQAPDA